MARRLKHLVWLEEVDSTARARLGGVDVCCKRCGDWFEVEFENLSKLQACGCGEETLPAEHCVDIHSTDVLDQALARIPGPVIVNFWKEGFGPCAFGMRRVERTAAVSEGRFVLLRAHIDVVQRGASDYDVQRYPTLLRFIESQPLARVDGCVLREDLVSFALKGADLRLEDG